MCGLEASRVVLVTKDVEDVATSDIAGRVDGLRHLLEADAIGNHVGKPVRLNSAVFAWRESEAAMVAEQGVELFEQLIGGELAIGSIPDEASDYPTPPFWGIRIRCDPPPASPAP